MELYYIIKKAFADCFPKVELKIWDKSRTNFAEIPPSLWAPLNSRRPFLRVKRPLSSGPGSTTNRSRWRTSIASPAPRLTSAVQLSAMPNSQACNPASLNIRQLIKSSMLRANSTKHALPSSSPLVPADLTSLISEQWLSKSRKTEQWTIAKK